MRPSSPVCRPILIVGLALVASVAAGSDAGTDAKAASSKRYDPRDLTGIWMQTPDRPFTSYPLTPEYQASMRSVAVLGLSLPPVQARYGAIRQAGAKPLLLAGTLFIFSVVGGYVVNYGMLLLLLRS